MRFIAAALMAMFALSDTTDAKYYPNLNKGQHKGDKYYSDC